MDEILKYIREVQQPRSRFQIERFVLGQHDTLHMQFYQLCLELQSSIFSIKKVELDIRKARARAAQLKTSTNEIDLIEAEEIELGLAQTEMVLFGAKRELDILLEIWEQFEHKFSREEIEKNQEEYWHLRLIRQATSQALGQGSVDMGNIDALKQAGALDKFLSTQGIIEGGADDVRNLES